MRYRKLLEPGKIGSLALKNRVVMAPMGTGFASDDGLVTERLLDYYGERAGGCGLIICGVLSVDAPAGNSLDCQLGISDDRYLPGLKRLTSLVHSRGAKIAAQLVHGGKLAIADLLQGTSPASPSESSLSMKETLRDLTREEFEGIVRRFANMPPGLKSHELTRAEINRLTRKFAEAAERAREAGFDGVEIHAGHGYLISSFLSPAANKRQDEYGGDLYNRARFLLEILAAIREKSGEDFPVWCRTDCREFGIKGGITPEDGLKLAVMLEEAGADAIHVSGYGGTIGGFIDAPVVYPPGNLVNYAAAIKKAVKMQVIAVGRIGPEPAEQLLLDNKADFIAMGRPILAAPDFTNKLAAGKRDDIRPCIYCYNCVSQHLEGLPTVCAVNPAAGREKEFNGEPATRPKKVAVIGGGPAGMEAARVAAARGHRVTLFEKEKRLGGSLVFAAIANADFEALLNWMKRQIEQLPIDLRLGQKADCESISRIKPDTVIIATGPVFSILAIEGGGQSNIITGPQLRGMMNSAVESRPLPGLTGLMLRTAGPVLRRFSPGMVRKLAKLWLPLGKKVVIAGGDLVPVELAGMLAESGRKVTVLSEQPDIAGGMPIPARWRILKALRKNGVELITDVSIEKVDGKTVTLRTFGGDSQTIEADTVILAGETMADDRLFHKMEGNFPEVYRIGNCGGTRLLKEAIEEGMKLGLSI